jgi:hypothetical protein
MVSRRLRASLEGVLGGVFYSLPSPRLGYWLVVVIFYALTAERGELDSVFLAVEV